jgi:hypothetical protein
MTRLILVSLLVIGAASLPQTVAATNYHEYKKFDSPGTTGGVWCRCHAKRKEHWNYCYSDKPCGTSP